MARPSDNEVVVLALLGGNVRTIAEIRGRARAAGFGLDLVAIRRAVARLVAKQLVTVDRKQPDKLGASAEARVVLRNAAVELDRILRVIKTAFP